MKAARTSPPYGPGERRPEIVGGVWLGRRMEIAQYLDHLAADAARLRTAGARDLSAKVPTCPDWNVADLLRHVADVYTHKTESMRRGEWPDPWPREPAGDDPVALLDEALAELLSELTSRKPADPAITWYGPDQTVGFWIRRMAQETVVHRVDGELALGLRPSPIPADLAVDGVDEVLVSFLAYASKQWPDAFADRLATCSGQTVAVTAGDHRWLVRLTSSLIEVTPDATASEADACVSGAPSDVLLWLWRRSPDADVQIEGDRALIAVLRDLLGMATQ
jgi:uncharacterized protein (TIGR03083 family)